MAGLYGSNATPVAQRLAADLGLDLATIQGSGNGGRITQEDVVRVARRQLAAGPQTTPRTGIAGATIRHKETLSGVRAVIARRMTESAFSAPHVTLHTEADASALVEARRQLNEALGPEQKIAYNSLLIAIAARALAQFPQLNARLVDDAIEYYEPINIGLAVDTERGLLAPVIRHAASLDLVVIQRESEELIARALSGQSLPDDLSDGTFTITNLGMFDIDNFTPIINQPQAAILGVGRIVSRPVDVGGAVGLGETVSLSLSFDHRIVDGGPAARFLQRIKQYIERPFTLLLDVH
jgi:pyruvate dehydrogenase E2 component (dihydrolipoamide acetyltransferase)